jgi:hypothetical protein
VERLSFREFQFRLVSIPHLYWSVGSAHIHGLLGICLFDVEPRLAAVKL